MGSVGEVPVKEEISGHESLIHMDFTNMQV